MGLFTRFRKPPAEISGLGSVLIAQRLEDARAAPAGSVLAVQRVQNAPELVYCFHPGPYAFDLIPYAAAPEIGLRLRFLIEPNPRLTQQRFELYLFSEAGEVLALEAFALAVQDVVQHELAQGTLDLPPCTTLDEWHAFRAGLNQLLYTRFGVTVDDCVPVDLGDSVDYAAILQARAAAQSTDSAPPVIASRPAPLDVPVASEPAAKVDGAADARALRRLFLELPAVSSAIRLLGLPAGTQVFQSHQGVLQRLSLLALSVSTMPALEWRAPDQPLEDAQQRRRVAHSQAAAMALDEAWALLSRLQLVSPAPWNAQFNETDRIVTNLEYHMAERRAAISTCEPQS